MPKLVKCQIGNEGDTIFHCLYCNAHLKDVPEFTKKDSEEAVFLCPKCNRFFDKHGVVPYNDADKLFPGESNISY